MQKHITAADAEQVRVVIVTLDGHLSTTIDHARARLSQELPRLSLTLHAAADWAHDPRALQRCIADIATGDIIVVNMLFMEEHIEAVLPHLQARRAHCDAMIGFMAAGEIVRLTRLGALAMDGEQKGPLALLKRLRGKRSSGGSSDAGQQQIAMLRRLPKILRFIPGSAQDLRTYFLTMQYWLAGSNENLVNMVRMLVDRCSQGTRRKLRGLLTVAAPREYPEVGAYHPALPGRIAATTEGLPEPARECRGTVGVLIMRSYVLAGNTGHYDGVIRALEARGLRVIPVFASGLDARPAVERFFLSGGRASIDALVSLTGFSLVGGPAYNDAAAASELLARLDVPYIGAHPVELQTLAQWEASDRGLMPVESTIMVAIPELDGATGPIVFGGRGGDGSGGSAADMCVHPERAEMLAARVDKIIALRRAQRAERRVAIVLFNYPPNAGNVGTAAFLAVFESLYNTLAALERSGYRVDLPASVGELRERIVSGNAAQYGAHANVHHRIPADDHVRREPYLKEIEAQWGPAPGRQQSDGASVHVLGAQFGNVLVALQPSMGYEGDPMRLLFERGFAPTHAFSAFYRYLREDFAAHAVLHFGTHGALEFMPGKQAGLSGRCWPDRMIADLPSFYLYAANNPSEGSIAKRRSGSTLISYLTPPVATAGLYRGLAELKASLDRWRQIGDGSHDEREHLAALIQAQASELDLAAAEPVWTAECETEVARLRDQLVELEHALIPLGLHVVGEPMSAEERIDLLAAVAGAGEGQAPSRDAIASLVSSHAADVATHADPAARAALDGLRKVDGLLQRDTELPAILHALDGGFIAPAPGGDLIRTQSILPTGRNIHGLDPFRIPSTFAVQDGVRQVQRLLERHELDGNGLPETVAIVLWGTDNIKTEGGPIAQALALVGARPRFDGYGRLAGAALIPLAELRRPRVDIVISISGIFRDLLPLQTKLLAEAALLAASADEPIEQNFVRKHALDYQRRHGCDLETAALRVFGNADGAYGSNVNNLVECSRWSSEDELAETYTRRKCFAYGRSGKPAQQSALLESMLAGVDLAYQNLDSVELGVTTVDTYFDTLGGISRAVRRAKGAAAPVYIGDQTRGTGVVRSLGEQVALETRTRMLNPKWYEGMLKHDYEGVRQIEVHLTNTMGWSATTGEVAPWVYQKVTQTFVLDQGMRERLARLNPTASVRVVNRLIEAHERNFWAPDAATLEALRRAGEDLEDRLEGVIVEAGA